MSDTSAAHNARARACDQPVSQCAARSLKDARSTGVNTAYAARTRARRDMFQPPICQLAGSAGIRLHGYGTRQQPPPHLLHARQLLQRNHLRKQGHA